jgi:hypothetical protein
MVDIETKGWDQQDLEQLLNIFHPGIRMAIA